MGEALPDRPWSRGKRLMLSVPIFIILIGILVFVSNATTVPWNNEPTGQTIATLSPDTQVTFDNPDGVSLPEQGSYQVRKRSVWIDAERESTGETQRIHVLIREPIIASSAERSSSNSSEHSSAERNDDAEGINSAEYENDTQITESTGNTLSKLPGIVFMHGAGYGSATDSFGDVAHDMASAGFVTAVLDKPAWSTNDVTRDYPASARIYDQVIDLLRDLDEVDDAKVGIYATSESTWISSYLLGIDHNIAFQILLSPMVYSPRQSLGFLAAQDFTLVGAHDGYQSIVRRLFNVDSDMFGLTNFDIATLNPQAYSIPTFVAYGSKDVMTAQVEGTEAMLHMAHRAGNWDMTVRGYSVANHVLRLGDEANTGTPLADQYVVDIITWAQGTVHGLHQTSERVAGVTLYQSIAVPTELGANRGLTVYGVLLHVFMLITLCVAFVVSLLAWVRTIRFRWRRFKLEKTRTAHARDSRSALGFSHGFGSQLLTLTITTLATLMLFAAGLGQVVMAVVRLAWGGAPDEEPGLMYWSWPVVQVVCTLVVWAWSRVFARLIEVASLRGVISWPPRKGAIKAVLTGRAPVLASTRLGRVLFWSTAIAMFAVLLVFAFWGLFIY